jgi:hypothetical protein
MNLRRSASLSALALFIGLAAGPASAQESASGTAWKPFQEFGFLTGAWSGTAESGGRVGGRVSRFTTEMGGNYLVHRGTALFPAQKGQPEESTEETGYFAYDRERRRYVAFYFFSTGVSGTYDVDFPSEGVVRLQSTSQLNYESGARTRLTIARKSDTELSYQLEVATGGKDYVTFLSSKLTRK